MARWAMAKATLRKLYSDKEQNVGTRIAFIQPEQQNNICFACCWSTTVQTGTYYYIIMFTQYCWKVMIFRKLLSLVTKKYSTSTYTTYCKSVYLYCFSTTYMIFCRKQPSQSSELLNKNRRL